MEKIFSDNWNSLFIIFPEVLDLILSDVVVLSITTWVVVDRLCDFARLVVVLEDGFQFKF